MQVPSASHRHSLPCWFFWFLEWPALIVLKSFIFKTSNVSPAPATLLSLVPSSPSFPHCEGLSWLHSAHLEDRKIWTFLFSGCLMINLNSICYLSSLLPSRRKYNPEIKELGPEHLCLRGGWCTVLPPQHRKEGELGPDWGQPPFEASLLYLLPPFIACCREVHKSKDTVYLHCMQSHI